MSVGRGCGRRTLHTFFPFCMPNPTTECSILAFCQAQLWILWGTGLGLRPESIMSICGRKKSLTRQCQVPEARIVRNDSLGKELSSGQESSQAIVWNGDLYSPFLGSPLILLWIFLRHWKDQNVLWRSPKTCSFFLRRVNLTGEMNESRNRWCLNEHQARNVSQVYTWFDLYSGPKNTRSAPQRISITKMFFFLGFQNHLCVCTL